MRFVFWRLRGFYTGEVAVIKAIPKKLLIHAAELQREVPGAWGPAGLEPVSQLTKIRIEPSSRIVRDKNSAELQLAALMFFDAKNSRPAAQQFAEDQIVDFGGEKYQIVSVEPLTDEGKLHHYEIGMVKYAGKGDDIH